MRGRGLYSFFVYPVDTIIVMFLTLICLTFAIAGSSAGDDFSWTGGGDGSSWTDAKNWGTDRYPGDGEDDDTATITNGSPHVVLGTNITLARLDLGGNVWLRGGKITINEAATWSGGTLSTTLTVSPNASMSIEGNHEKRLEVRDGSGNIKNAGELTISGSGRVFMLFDPQIHSSGRLVFRGNVNVVGSRCCLLPANAIVSTGEIIVAPDLIPTTKATAKLSQLAFRTKGPINIMTNAILALDGGVHELSDGVRVTGGGMFRIANLAQTTIGRLSLTSGTRLELADRSRLLGTTVFQGSGDFAWTGGTVLGSINVEKGATLTLSGSGEKILNASQGKGQLINKGNVVLKDSGRLSFMAAGSGLENLGSFLLKSDAPLVAYNCCTVPNTITNKGSFRKTGSTGTTAFKGVFLENKGRFEIDKGMVDFSGGAEFVQTSGSTTIKSGTLKSIKQIRLEGGTFEGNGTIDGTLVNGAFLSPGLISTAGKITVKGDYRQRSNGKLILDVGGRTQDSSDYLEIQGDARLHGSRRVQLINNFRPTLGDTVELVRYKARHGTFYNVEFSGPGNVFPIVYEEPVVDDPAMRKPGRILLVANGVPRDKDCQVIKIPPGKPDENKAALNAAKKLVEIWAPATLIFDQIFSNDETKPRTQVSENELKNVNLGEGLFAMGVIGRSPEQPNNRNRVLIRFAYSKFDTIVELAGTMMHEFRHAQDILSAQFMSGEAAPFMTRKEYVIHRMMNEFNAFWTGATILEQIADIDPRYEICRATILENSKTLTDFALADNEEAQKTIVGIYTAAGTTDSYQEFHDRTAGQLAALADVKKRVDAMKLSQSWQDEVRFWEPICQELLAC